MQHTLSILDKTAERFRLGAAAGALRLVAVEAFAEMWLMPRLAAFRSAHPEIVIEFETSLDDHHEVNPGRREFDVWIAFVASVPRTLQSEVLFEETLVPVCSPGFLASRGDPSDRPIFVDGRCSTISHGMTTGRTGLPTGRPARRTCPGRRATVSTR